MDKHNQREKSVQEKLELSEERFKIFVKHTPAAVAMFDRDMRYIAVSDRWLEDYKIEGEEVIGKSHYQVFPRISDEWVEIYQICLTGVTKKGEDTIVNRKGEEEWIKWEIHPWYESPGKVGGIIIYADLITDRKETEIELVKAREKAEEASRAKSTFIANMSHEFRTPLNAILGYSQVLQNSGDLSEEQSKFVNEIAIGGKQLLSMINNVIDLSKIETSKIDYNEITFSVEQLLKGVVDENLSSFKKKGIGLSTSILKGVPKTVTTDFDKLHRILEQLIENALKFTQKGKVEVTIAYEKIEDSATGVGGKLSLIVSDSGIGIPEEKIGVIFKPFVKMHPETNQGTGLGLMLVQRLSRFLGGKVEVKSDVGSGTEVKVIIPVKASEELFDNQKKTYVVEEKTDESEELTAEEISDFILSLSNKDREVIKQAIEFQDLETLSVLDKHLGSVTHSQRRALKKIETSAKNFDFRFLNEIQQLVE